MNFSSRTVLTRDDWQTPIYIIEKLGKFDLDPCANCNDPTRLAEVGYTRQDDGLYKEWFGRVWLNPPYGRQIHGWMNRLAEHGNGIALIPPRMGAKWFQDSVLEKFDAMLFHRGRIPFINAETGMQAGDNNADSVFVAFGINNVNALDKSGLPGVLWVR